MALAFDEFGRPFIIIKEQEQKTRLRGLDAQKANISAGKAVARILHTSLGTKGMDKMLQSPDGELTIRNYPDSVPSATSEASTREFVEVVFAYWVIFPDSEQQLIKLAQDLVTSDALMEQIKALAYRHPDKLYMETTGGKNKGYRAEMTVVTYCRNRKDIDDKSKFRILLSFGQHGRELITSELALRILSILSGEQFPPNMDPISLNNTFERLVIKMLSF
ncbi:hypothetical protein ACSBR2_015045 [Camellia fascicularis]